MTTRLLIVGLDGATWDLARPWIEAGELPTLARLVERGASMTLRSTIPATSPPAWTSIITGQNPGRHGVYDFVRREPGSYHLHGMRADFTSYRSIFEIASEAGRRVAAINVPMTYPAREVNGLMVSGLGAARAGAWTWPRDLGRELERDGYELDVGDSYAEVGDAAFIADMKRVMSSQARFAMTRLRDETWDLFMIVFRGTDEAQGFLWHHIDPDHPWHDPEAAARYGDGILEIYRESDRLLGELVEAAGEEAALIVLSDHGGGPLHREVYLNNWLREQGYLVMKPPHERPLAAALRRVGLTRERLAPFMEGRLWRALRDRVPLGLQHALVPGEMPTLAASVDWSRSRAYSYGYVGQIYVNRVGREPEGIVPEAEVPALIDEITARLETLVDPEDGRPVVDAVYRAEELYHGPYRDRAPDLNLIMRDMSYIAHPRRELAYDRVFGPVMTAESGTHRLDGIAVIAGPWARAGVALKRHSVMDIAPTALYALDLPIPSTMDGRVIEGAIEPEWLALRPPRIVATEGEPPPDAPTGGGWSEAEEAEIEQRLRDLGYLG